MPGPVVLATHALCKRYRGRTVVDRVSIAVERGDVYGFLGPNGAGKSTTLRMLLGLVRPTGGRVELFGRGLADRRVLARVGAIVEAPALYTYLTGADNLRMLADLGGGAPAARQVEVLERVGLRDRAGDPVRIYSHGMKQRLAIAAALLPRPELIILDEPTNGLDPMGIRDMRALVRSLADDDGITVVLSSHLLAEVEAVCNRATILARGRTRWEGDVAELLAERRRVRIRARPAEAAARALAGAGAVREVEPGLFHVTGALVAPAELVDRLVAAGVKVDEIVAEAPTLEEVFVSLVGAGEAS
ncbi:MAG TPA: ABC transporter ATP-binding protein [Kofleriaceae bacterium]|nr:ABC transporter ATP-binding protein [Kofleriaceae bacterium]